MPTKEQLLENKIRELREELELAQETIKQLKLFVKTNATFPEALKLTKNESKLLSVLMSRNVVSKDAIMTAVYSERVNPPAEGIVQVQIYHIRKKLRPYGITVNNVWGRGYSLPEESKTILRKMLDSCVT